MTRASIAGIGMTPFAKTPDIDIRTLAGQAVYEALSDAQMSVEDIGMVFAANAAGGVLHGQEMVSGQMALRHTGLLGVPIINVENACASSSSAFHLACLAVTSGAVDVALAVGFEKLTHKDKQRSLTAIGTAADLSENAEARRQVLRDLLGQPDLPGGPSELSSEEESLQPPPAHTVFMQTYAGEAIEYMAATGATREDFAQVAVKNHRHALLNHRAQYGANYSVKDVLESREIVAPLTLLMCSPVSDGAAAIVVCSAERARKIAHRTVDVRATVVASGRDRALHEESVVQRAVSRAYEQAGLGPQEIDVIELHDAAAPAELVLYEEIGLCAQGSGPELLRSGETQLGGKSPTNVSGGLISRGHPIGATGAAQLFELTQQLRGEAGRRQVDGARVGLAQNSGGHLGVEPAVTAVTILVAGD